MSGNNEDDFWNTSSSSGFNFDEDEDFLNVPSSTANTDAIFNSQFEKSSVLPIHSIISKANLNLILGDIDIKLHKSTVPPVEETIKNMLYGRKYSLNVYRSIEHKTQLLDQSIDTYDGNVILTVTVYLARSLSRSIFHHLLSKREAAIKHYSTYLVFHNRLQDLADLYTATGHTSNLKILFFLTIKNISNKEHLLRKLEQNTSYSSNWKDISLELSDYKNFLRWQIHQKQDCESPVEQLAILCKNHYENRESQDLNIFRQLLKISDFQYDWIIFNTLISLEQWKKLMSTFISENWLAKKKTLKSCLRPELFILSLYRHRPPVAILEEFLSSNILDSETSLAFAKKMQCHKFVTDYYISQKDRLALLDYKNKVASQSEEFFYMENALYSSDKVWKN